jgi:hypothetical protein
MHPVRWTDRISDLLQVETSCLFMITIVRIAAHSKLFAASPSATLPWRVRNAARRPRA